MTNCLFDIRGNSGWRRGCCWLFYNGARVTNHEKLIRLLDNGRSRNTCPSIRPPGTATLTGLGRQAAIHRSVLSSTIRYRCSPDSSNERPRRRTRSPFLLPASATSSAPDTRRQWLSLLVCAPAVQLAPAVSCAVAVAVALCPVRTFESD